MQLKLNDQIFTRGFLIAAIAADQRLKILDLNLQLGVATLEGFNAVEHRLYDIIDIIFGELIHRVLKN